MSLKLRYKIREEIHIWWPLASVILAVAIPISAVIYLLNLILIS